MERARRRGRRLRRSLPGHVRGGSARGGRVLLPTVGGILESSLGLFDLAASLLQKLLNQVELAAARAQFATPARVLNEGDLAVSRRTRQGTAGRDQGSTGERPSEDSVTTVGANAEDGRPERLPPADLGAERAVIGAVLHHAAVLDRAATVVEPDDFYRPAHTELFREMLRMRDEGRPVDAISLADRLGDRLFKLGGLHSSIRAGGLCAALLAMLVSASPDQPSATGSA
ncbi:DnaB-like helicase N-terminal domain-containing protein [Pseudonocardia sp. NPDC049154]|uniref:DnaB-like helicase N-terminal domain-containing protein n=1 Tax=Pseudonocardia sp. NPDC049154 TaxID=3155501 RepID=UPI0033F7F993